ncbi:pilus assembly protein, partial [Pseudomonas sp. AB12(2023)]|nr:pilus assembly protein [Pseudomonas sp. AB12(2023)]
MKTVCLTDDMILHVSESHVDNVHVLSYMERLDYRGLEYTVKKVRVEDIESLYRTAGSDLLAQGRLGNGQKTSDMQRMVMQTILKASDKQASDVHLMLQEKSLEIKFRVHGDLEPAGQLLKMEGDTFLNTIYASMCEAAEEIFKPHTSQDARMKKEFVKQCGLFGARVATRPM